MNKTGGITTNSLGVCAMKALADILSSGHSPVSVEGGGSKEGRVNRNGALPRTTLIMASNGPNTGKN